MKCRRCNITMVKGTALVSTPLGHPDFPGCEIVTLSNGGSGRMVEVMKCPQCGHSVTTNKEDDEHNNR